MTTRRRIICCILSVLAFSSCGVVVNDAPQRIVRIKVLADPALRERNPRWDAEVRGLIEASSDYFEKEFVVRFVTQSTAAWPQEKISSTGGILARLKQDFPMSGKKGDY